MAPRSKRTYREYGNTYGGFRDTGKYDKAGRMIRTGPKDTCPNCGNKWADGCDTGCTDRD